MAGMTLLMSCVVVAFVTFLSTALQVTYTDFHYAIGLIGNFIYTEWLGIDERSIGPMTGGMYIGVTATVLFGVPATMIYALSRRYFNGRLSAILTIVWLIGFLCLLLIGPNSGDRL